MCWAVVSHTYCTTVVWNGMTDVLSTYCWSGFTYKWVSLTTTYGLFRKGKIDIENVVGKWHASEYLSYKFADWENCKFVQCGFQRQPWCHSFLLGFLLPEFSIRIAHPTDIMLVLGTRRFCGFFGMRETWKVWIQYLDLHRSLVWLATSHFASCLRGSICMAG